MKIVANILLGLWLMLTGLIALTDFDFRVSSRVLAIVAVLAGILLILADRSEKFSAHIADFALGIWLLAIGLVPLLNIRFRGSNAVLEVLAVAAGALVLIKR